MDKAWPTDPVSRAPGIRPRARGIESRREAQARSALTPLGNFTRALGDSGCCPSGAPAARFEYMRSSCR